MNPMVSRHRLSLTCVVMVAVICVAVQLAGQAIAEERPDKPRPEPQLAPRVPPGQPAQLPGPGRFGAFMGRHLGPDMDKKDVEQIVHMLRAWRMMEEVGLTEEQTLKFLNLERKMKEEAGKLAKEREKVQRELLKLVEDARSDDAAITKQLQALEQQEEKQRELLRDFEQRIKGDLTVRQRAKMKLFKARFERDMRQLVEHIKQRQQFGRPLPEGRSGEHQRSRWWLRGPGGTGALPQGPPVPPGNRLESAPNPPVPGRPVIE